MSETKKYIKGHIKAKFSGVADDVTTSDAHLANKLFEIFLNESKISDAEYCESYDVEERSDTLYLPYITGASVYVKDASSNATSQKEFVHVWITNIKIEHSIRQNNRSAGELSGYVYMTIPEKGTVFPKREMPKPKTIRSEPSSLGCLGNTFVTFLSFLGMAALLLWLWCLLFGHCSWNGLIAGCQACEPCLTKRDTVVIYRDTTTTKSDSIQLGTGDLQFSLYWNSYEDLDLVVLTPNGNAVYYGNQNADAGTMDVDMNASDGTSSTPVENIFWKTGKVPSGKYTCFVSYYKRNKNSTIPENFTVKVKIKDQVQTFENKLSEAYNDRSRGTFVPFDLENANYAVKIVSFEYK
jgi:hypothetical protein